MSLLLMEIWFFLIIAFLMGAITQWFFSRRTKRDHSEENNGGANTTPNINQTQVPADTSKPNEGASD